MKIISHRGANTEFPENTFASFDRALELGVDALETDLLLTKDRRIVLRHDNLINMKGKTYYIDELTFEELQNIDLGGGETIPSLEAFLDRYASKTFLILDLKCSHMVPELMKKVAAVKEIQNLHVTSFLHNEILQISQSRPDISRSIVLAALPISFVQLFDESHSREVSLYRGYLERTMVEKLMNHKILVRVYPVNFLREAQTFAEWGVEGIFTDEPKQMQALRK